MKQITPYKNAADAVQSLDNGGRFYNLLTTADDGIISSAELAKVGGLFNEKQKMILFLELSLHELENEAKEAVISKLDDGLKASYEKYRAQVLLPSEAGEIGVLAKNAIITGVPKVIASTTKFTAMVMIPIMAGKVMTMIMIPISEKYDVYELRDEATSDTFLIAHAKEATKLPEEKIIVAGVLKELKPEKGEKTEAKKFLEINYFLHI
ncbi:MAG: hypothetical protein V4687_02250 [Bacteroidota bacterium]